MTYIKAFATALWTVPLLIVGTLAGLWISICLLAFVVNRFIDIYEFIQRVLS